MAAETTSLDAGFDDNEFLRCTRKGRRNACVELDLKTDELSQLVKGMALGKEDEMDGKGGEKSEKPEKGSKG